MKSFLAAIFLLTSALAFSGEIELLNQRVSMGNSYNGGSFDINENLGRAWVELTFTDSDPDSSDETVRVQVKGMSYDKSTQEIIIADETGRTVCGYKKRFFGVRPTGNCIFKETNYMTTYDDGFEIERVEKVKITLKF
jgi:hypothetical protein